MRFKVNNHEWELRFIQANSEKLRNSIGVHTLGACDNNLKTVFIANNLSDYMTERVICHELTHAICLSWNISIPLETEEWLCDFMSKYGKEIIYILDDLMRSVFRNVV